MKIIKEKIYKNLDINKYLQFANKDVLFFDIETTGFNRNTSYVYMMGYIYYEDSQWFVEQHLAQSLDEEVILLKNFKSFINYKKALISFNGDTFDIPYICEKILNHNLNISFEEICSIDIYKKIKAYKKILGLKNCKLKTVEKLVGINREDKYSGGQLIDYYYSYIKSKDISTEKTLLLHNKEDMIALMELIRIYDIINGLDKINEYYLFKYNLDKDYLTIFLKFSNTLNFDLTLNISNITINLNEVMTIKVPLIKKEMKYYFTDYKNYYFLPDKGEAIHKSIAGLLPRDRRIKAKASNCYVKKQGTFIPLLDKEIFDCFRENYKEKDYYAYLNEDEIDTRFLTKYCDHIIKYIENLKR